VSRGRQRSTSNTTQRESPVHNFASILDHHLAQRPDAVVVAQDE
jgi:hypothetical protein